GMRLRRGSGSRLGPTDPDLNRDRRLNLIPNPNPRRNLHLPVCQFTSPYTDPIPEGLPMTRILAFAGVVLLVVGSYGQAQTKDDKGPPKKAFGKTPEEIVENLLKAMDADGDGKISRQEAKGKLAEDFDKVDTNKDGYLDRKELRALAERIAANQ